MKSSYFFIAITLICTLPLQAFKGDSFLTLTQHIKSLSPQSTAAVEKKDLEVALSAVQATVKGISTVKHSLNPNKMSESNLNKFTEEINKVVTVCRTAFHVSQLTFQLKELFEQGIKKLASPNPNIGNKYDITTNRDKIIEYSTNNIKIIDSALKAKTFIMGNSPDSQQLSRYIEQLYKDLHLVFDACGRKATYFYNDLMTKYHKIPAK